MNNSSGSTTPSSLGEETIKTIDVNMDILDGTLEDGNLDFDTWLSLQGSLYCGVCFEAYSHTNFPISSSKCGYTICRVCAKEHVIKGVQRPLQFMPCPIPGCKSTHSFPRALVPNIAILECIQKLSEMENGSRTIVERLNNEINTIQKSAKQKLQDMEQQLWEKNAKIAILEFQLGPRNGLDEGSPKQKVLQTLKDEICKRDAKIAMLQEMVKQIATK